ncbi:pyruvate kinase [bacterium]|nr:pyruvate kinase [bacterium]
MALPKTREPSSPEVPPPSPTGTPWDPAQLARLIEEVGTIRADALALEGRFAKSVAAVHPTFRRSARNLIHYLALRRHDVRALQEQLAMLGLSSLGRSESHVLAGLDAVLVILHRLAGRPGPELTAAPAPLTFGEGQAALADHTAAVLGPRPRERGVRIMVTMPSEAATDYELVRQLLAAGMDCMRINCAHDDAAAWARMIEHLRRAERESGRTCRILMDIAGPKLRTGAIDPRTQSVHVRPTRDRQGAVTAPARVWLTSAVRPAPPPAAAAVCLHLRGNWLRAARAGDQLAFQDLRGKSRRVTLAEAAAGGRWANAEQSAFLALARPLALRPLGARRARRLEAVPAAASDDQLFLTLRGGDLLSLTRGPIPGRPAVVAPSGRVIRPATISCTLPEVFADVRVGDRIWFDDGRIGGVVEGRSRDRLRVRITVAGARGRLRADKGINLPDSRLRLGALTAKDLADLAFVVRHADLVGMSFVRAPADIRLLRRHLRRLGAAGIGIMLKIETTEAFEHLPSLLLAAMQSERVGVMIARGDLAVECGYERLAEVQEEVLWFCEAAHVPVVWATQVLETLAKTGVPSRAEITDAAMGERAECVMLNKGPFLLDAARALHDILRRMEAHQRKKSARLRRLRLSSIAVD